MSTPRPGTPAVLIAGTHSGAGKTTVAAVLTRELRRRGLRVQPFKIGPDFIDPAYHSEAADRRSINLDVWMMGEAGVRRSFQRGCRDADVAVIEAMGAVYDGAGTTDHGSAAHVSRLLEVPLVVVLDVWGMTRTAAAVLQGIIGFAPSANIVGCVLNRVGSPKHAQLIMTSMPPRLRSLVVGAIQYRRELEIPERHLGLLTVEENQDSRENRAAAQDRAAAGLDMDRIIGLLGARKAGVTASEQPTPPAPTVARVAIAQDRAFCFYYEGNLRALRDAGCELVPFRPISDQRLPPGTDAVYIGGGYPESFAGELTANTSLAAELRHRAGSGMPIYAECGGLVCLARSLTGFDGHRRQMFGVLPLDVTMDPEFLAIRYVEVRTRSASLLGPAGTVVRGQEFHQSRITEAGAEPALYEVTTSDGDTFQAGFHLGNVVAGYIHLYFADHQEVADSFARTAVAARPAGA